VSDASVDVGQAVTFTAAGEGGAGQKLSYRWNFDDKTGRPGRQVTHRFKEKGSYNVVVSVTTPEDPVGAPDIIRVRVGPAPKGPDRQGGGTNSSAAAPTSGTAAGGSGGTSGGTGQAAGGPAQATSPAKTARRRPRPDTAGGEQIEGTLLSDATVVPQKPAARKRAARTGNDRVTEGGFGVPGVAWGVLITLGLAGTGALVELRSALPWARRRPA
jgi:hypothetical protein